jgi:hypothetical protein
MKLYFRSIKETSVQHIRFISFNLLKDLWIIISNDLKRISGFLIKVNVRISMLVQ